MKIFSEDSYEVDIMSSREPQPLMKDGRYAIFLEPYWPTYFDEPYSFAVYKNDSGHHNTFCWLGKEDLLWLRNRIDELLEN